MKKALPFLVVAVVVGLIVWLRRRVAQERAAATPLDTVPYDPNMVVDGLLFESPEYDAYKAAGGPLGYIDWAMENGYIQT